MFYKGGKYQSKIAKIILLGIDKKKKLSKLGNIKVDLGECINDRMYDDLQTDNFNGKASDAILTYSVQYYNNDGKANEINKE